MDSYAKTKITVSIVLHAKQRFSKNLDLLIYKLSRGKKYLRPLVIVTFFSLFYVTDRRDTITMFYYADHVKEYISAVRHLTAASFFYPFPQDEWILCG